MTTVFQDMISMIYDSDLAVDATYRPVPGIAFSTRVTHRQPDINIPLFGTGASRPNVMIGVPIADVEDPKENDEIEIGDTVYIVKNKVRDDNGVEWTLEVEEK